MHHTPTNYNKINPFEVGIVSMIVVGFIIVGYILFSGLTPRTQTHVASAFDIFDIHTQVAKEASTTVDVMKFAFDIPNQFYEQFYIAFQQVATLPSDTFDFPTDVAHRLAVDFTSAVNELSLQVADGYAAQNRVHAQQADTTAKVAEEAVAGKVLGAMVDRSNEILNSIVAPTPAPAQEARRAPEEIKVDYEYTPPNLEQVKILLSQLKVE